MKKTSLMAALWLGAALGARAAEPEIVLSLQDKGRGVFDVWASFSVEASTQTVWSVLADYDRIAGFVSDLRRSRVRERRGDSIILEQESTYRVLPFLRRIRLVLQVREEPDRISFEEISHEHFWFYEGFWRIAEEGGSVRLVYSLTAKRKFPAPSFITKLMVRRGALKLLNEVRREILRRVKAGSP